MLDICKDALAFGADLDFFQKRTNNLILIGYGTYSRPHILNWIEILTIRFEYRIDTHRHPGKCISYWHRLRIFRLKPDQ